MKIDYNLFTPSLSRVRSRFNEFVMGRAERRMAYIVSYILAPLTGDTKDGEAHSLLSRFGSQRQKSKGG